MSLAAQRDLFVRSEGDAWFERNRSAIQGPNDLREHVIGVISGHLPTARTTDVLEIGCASGANLLALGERRSIVGHGVDPSGAAVAHALEMQPGLDIRTGTTDALPFTDASMDVVWFGFCLYLVDRTLLHRSVAEADRVLRNGGLLVILDFDAPHPVAREYHHVPGVTSYKLNTSALFLADPAYVLAEKSSFSATGVDWEADPGERIGLWICRKDTDNAYLQQ
jgi:SAM-dependent methyltransferase